MQVDRGAAPLPRTRRVVRALLALSFAGMGALHFSPQGIPGMAAMVPQRLTGGDRRRARFLVRLTGACEIAGAVGLLGVRTRPIAAASLLVFLAAVFPANVIAARDPERFGRVAVPLVPRAVAQVVLGALVAAAGWPDRR